MRLIRFGPVGDERPGVMAPGPAGDPVGYDVSGVVADFDAGFWSTGGLDLVRGAVASGKLPRFELDRVRLGSPISLPPKILCVGLNYHEHARESGMTLPTEPVLFMKAPNTVVGPDDPVLIPPGSVKTDWEVELGVVIGRPARYLPDPAAAREVIGGFVLSTDLSEREYQLERGGQWDKGKSCETFNPLGPWLVTADEVPDPQALWLELTVDGQRMQYGLTADMVFPVDYLVWYLSQFMVLEPGDLINTGTPAGVGMGQQPPRYLRAGDTFTVAGQELGSQRHECRQAGPELDRGPG
ncbi:fumarylacetoacetate hydrolase family protein [Natronosporangium hydrolyticum]|uniref:Fumarylacetoacetate hydrolase family protein n=1 Tax=Natronosporangium hydrolyticum TaxID=2811111 RepID=A0A895Y4X9_9ACTN|nr:fumarylacetoacetate hydrolase family protein [Natronosporangium hydrolyticum]QSB12747.1 fumarylacetoacetate hydrolase family protein [Natronosporangium hydrolyticum]